jgi:hypothetical protein
VVPPIFVDWNQVWKWLDGVEVLRHRVEPALAGTAGISAMASASRQATTSVDWHLHPHSTQEASSGLSRLVPCTTCDPRISPVWTLTSESSRQSREPASDRRRLDLLLDLSEWARPTRRRIRMSSAGGPYQLTVFVPDLVVCTRLRMWPCTEIPSLTTGRLRS